MTFNELVQLFQNTVVGKEAMNATKRAEITNYQADFYAFANMDSKGRYVRPKYSKRMCYRAVRVGLAYFQSSDYRCTDNNWMYIIPGRVRRAA